MSWKDRLENVPFTIVTGDGEEYFPLWKSTSKEKEFNTSKYEFINQDGSLITRKRPKSNKHSLVFWFQGDDNIDQVAAFEISANDPRLWVVTHPFYGVISGQPLNLRIDDKDFNATQITVDFWESIDSDLPSAAISVLDSIREKIIEVNNNAINSFSIGVDVLVSDISNIRETTTLSSSNFIPTQNDLANYSNIVSEAGVAVDTIIEDPLNYITITQRIITAPSLFEDVLSNKLSSYKDAFSGLSKSIFSKTDKFNFESQAASVISGVAESLINTSEGDFVTRADVELANNNFLSLFSDYLLILDENQVDGNDVVNYWSPNPDLLRSLFDLVFFTSNRLFQISFSARQERIVELERDSNLIILTHRFLGLDENDENIELFRNINDIRNNELFTIPKGRILRYYV